MKMLSVFKRYLPLLIIILMPFAALAETGDPAVDYPWLAGLLAVLQSVPAVGKVLGVLVSVLMVVSSLMTVLGAALDGIAKALSGVLNMVGLQGAADKIIALHAKLAPWVKFLSMYNVQKKPPVQ